MSHRTPKTKGARLGIRSSIRGSAILARRKGEAHRGILSFAIAAFCIEMMELSYKNLGAKVYTPFRAKKIEPCFTETMRSTAISALATPDFVMDFVTLRILPLELRRGSSAVSYVFSLCRINTVDPNRIRDFEAQEPSVAYEIVQEEDVCEVSTIRIPARRPIERKEQAGGVGDKESLLFSLSSRTFVTPCARSFQASPARPPSSNTASRNCKLRRFYPEKPNSLTVLSVEAVETPWWKLSFSNLAQKPWLCPEHQLDDATIGAPDIRDGSRQALDKRLPRCASAADQAYHSPLDVETAGSIADSIVAKQRSLQVVAVARPCTSAIAPVSFDQVSSSSAAYSPNRAHQDSPAQRYRTQTFDIVNVDH
ncbi:hypothetical protein FHL15_006476 [Xylaria flabelliformis]|uniref:Uncharacterized protein n=1 Tax=Xylaria flabelliformis TaxID=2512241 RepID=A0A553HX73_9PEZI|nr:hypothetical protein FHL15_006476 [Xylaria flabelliformis]